MKKVEQLVRLGLLEPEGSNFFEKCRPPGGRLWQLLRSTSGMTLPSASSRGQRARRSSLADAPRAGREAIVLVPDFAAARFLTRWFSFLWVVEHLEKGDASCGCAAWMRPRRPHRVRLRWRRQHRALCSPVAPAPAGFSSFNAEANTWSVVW